MLRKHIHAERRAATAIYYALQSATREKKQNFEVEVHNTNVNTGGKDEADMTGWPLPMKPNITLIINMYILLQIDRGISIKRLFESQQQGNGKSQSSLAGV